jgi:simple sugar transport system substrate-binding protein
MTNKKLWLFTSVVLVLAMVLSACGGAATTQAPAPTQAPAATQAPAPTEAPAATQAPAPTEAPTATQAPATTEAPAAGGQPFTFGLLFVGPYNDHGWSQAHYDAGQYVEKNVPGAKMVYVDKVNSADRPGTTPAQLAEELLAKGAKFIIFNSDDMKDSSNDFAKAHPDIPTILASGDQAWKEGKDYQDLPNMGNIMGQMEYGKMIAGCAAALTTQTGKIGYLGPLINDETRRLASSVYLGAKYCWTNYLKKDAKDLSFKVTWIGFWFNIPGVTSDPTQVADDFFNSGYDVVVSGIDTTEALAEAKKFADSGKKVWAIPYDYKDACQQAESVCLGVPYFNWGPSYAEQIKSAQAGTWQPSWQWLPPYWPNINDPDKSAVGFNKGQALSSDASTTVDEFIKALGGGLNLWTGPINLQDKSVYLKDGEVATPQQIWYLPQLLEGMEGQSVPTS